MAEQAGFFATSTRPGVHAREAPAQQSDPLVELRRDLEAVLALLQATQVQGMGRKRSNRISHALAAARGEVRRALECLGAGGAGSE